MGKDDTDQGTARPAVKRVRSDQDHSKADTKKREDRRQGEGQGEGQGDGQGEGQEKNSHNGSEDGQGDEEHHDEDWLNQAPFRRDEGWEGWETRWRQSCWCGKGGYL